MATVEVPAAAQPQLPPQPPQPPPRRRGPANATVAMVLAGLLLFVATYLLLRDRETTYRVAAAAGEIRPGTVVGAGSFTPVDVKVDEAVLAGLVPAEELATLDGWVAANSLAAGELVSRQDLRAPAAPSDLRAMSLPVDPDRAVAGTLEVGDRVDVIAVVGGVGSFVAVDLEVIGVSSAGGGGALEGAGGSALTVAVDPQQGLALAQALTAGELDVLRSTGAQAVDVPTAPAAAPTAPAPPPPVEGPAPAAAPSASAAPADATGEVDPAPSPAARTGPAPRGSGGG